MLLYTGTPGSEGTPGGLVPVGRRIEHFLKIALELGRLCSNDPIPVPLRPSPGRSPRQGPKTRLSGSLASVRGRRTSVVSQRM